MCATACLTTSSPELERGSFDLVVMNHVLEHTTSPTDTLLTIKSAPQAGRGLRRGGAERGGARLAHLAFLSRRPPLRVLARDLRAAWRARPDSSVKADRRVGRGSSRARGSTRFWRSRRRRSAGSAKRGEQSDLPKDDDPAARAEALRAYGRWYWLTAASFRKKITHWKRQRVGVS